MSGVLVVYEYVMCDHDLHGVFLDIEKGRKYIKEKNMPYENDRKLASECYKCVIENHDRDIDDVFKNRDICIRACIETDRYGEYCKNRVSEHGSDYISYSGVEMELLD